MLGRIGLICIFGVIILKFIIMIIKEVDGIEYPVFKLNEKGEFKCPFCGEIHKHGNKSGHRIAHCKDKSITIPSDDFQEFYSNKSGYYVEEFSLYNKIVDQMKNETKKPFNAQKEWILFLFLMFDSKDRKTPYFLYNDEEIDSDTAYKLIEKQNVICTGVRCHQGELSIGYRYAMEIDF